MREINEIAAQSLRDHRPVLVAQLNTSDSAARRAAEQAGMQTLGVAPRGRYDAALRARHHVEEAETDSFAKADEENVRLAKGIAFALSQAAGEGCADAHTASQRHAAHVGLLYGLAYTGGKPSGAGTLKASNCLGSPTEAYARGFANLPWVEGLQEALETSEATALEHGNRLFILNLRPANVCQAASALGAFLARQQPGVLLVSGPEQASLPQVDVGLCVGKLFAQAFAQRGW